MREAACTGEHDDRRGPGTLTLDGERLLFRGAFHLSVPLAEIELVRTHRGALEVTWPGGTAAFHLGGHNAQDWAAAVRAPRPLVDLLGVPPGARVLVNGVVDFELRRQLRERAEAVLDRAAAAREPQVDLVLLGVRSADDLARLAGLTRLLRSDGVLWVLRTVAGDDPSAAQVIAAGRERGLSHIKTVPLTDGRAAHKFVLALRDL